jgi:hypothetical protein
MPQPDDI